MADAANASAESRLVALRAQLTRAREANIEAVATESRASRPLHRGVSVDSSESSPKNDHESGGDGNNGADGDAGRRRKTTKKRRRPERDENDVVSKALARRVNRARRAEGAGAGGASTRIEPEAEVVQVVSYGGAGRLQPGAAELVAIELADAEERRARGQKSAGPDDEAEDIGFINEHNKRFNKVVDKMYGKHDTVREIKDNLERGTALN